MSAPHGDIVSMGLRFLPPLSEALRVTEHKVDMSMTSTAGSLWDSS